MYDLNRKVLKILESVCDVHFPLVIKNGFMAKIVQGNLNEAQSLITLSVTNLDLCSRKVKARMAMLKHNGGKEDKEEQEKSGHSFKIESSEKVLSASKSTSVNSCYRNSITEIISVK
jgi:hypothetical protein